MATSSLSHRRSSGRQRLSLRSARINSASSPALHAAYQSSSKPPPLPRKSLTRQQQPSESGRATPRRYTPISTERLSEQAATDRGSWSSHATDEGGSSPFTMNPPPRAMGSRTADDDRNGNQNLGVGDLVDVPGGMHGTIRFIGPVRGKTGVFAGVELAREWAARGKNDGDVDGTHYFTTSIKGAGIFLPSNKAYKRLSPTFSSGDPKSPAPTTPSMSSYQPDRNNKSSYTPPTPSLAPKFSQSVGPARASSPITTKGQRPSLPRPESPLRRVQGSMSTPQARPSLGKPNLSKSLMGGPRYAPSPTSNKLGASMRSTRDVTGDPGKRQAGTPKPALRKPTDVRSISRSQSRSESRLGPEAMFDEEEEDADDTPVGKPKAGSSVQGRLRTSKSTSSQEDQIKMLRSQLEQRDKQLDKYAIDLEEMQGSIADLQTVTPKHNSTAARSSRGSGLDDLDSGSLRALVREKNEKIAALTNEFDTHRADFRDTIDILEHTSDETNRHYEERIASLEGELQNHTNRDEDVESVAQQLILLEKQVEDLEEGLEDSRRGESEARGEVEHLRGEVERGKAELRREKEKALDIQKYGGTGPSEASLQREIAHRDNEINGLKAIIHSLSRDASTNSPGSPRSTRKSRHNSKENSGGNLEAILAEERDKREKLEVSNRALENLVDTKTYREEDLEREIQRLRKLTAHLSGGSNGVSDRMSGPSTIYTATSQRNGTGHVKALPSREGSHQWRDQPISSSDAHAGLAQESDNVSTTMTDSSALWCEMCETTGHDILHCTSMSSQSHPPDDAQKSINGAAASKPAPISASTPKPSTINLSIQQTDPSDFPAPLSPAARSPVAPPASDTHTPRGSSSAPMKPTTTSNPLDSAMVPGKESGTIDASKWCALCERDGHESVDCPFDEF